MTTATRPSLPVCLLLCTLAFAASSCTAPTPPFAQLSGLIMHENLNEISGLSASKQHSGVLWAHNDGGNTAQIFAISQHGKLLAQFSLDGITNTDWEDIASFQHNGKNYLALADTGDNGGLRRTVQVHIIQEPQTLQSGNLPVQRSISFRWPDGAHNCEAIAVDAVLGQILFISKNQRPPTLYALPLDADPALIHTAEKIGQLHGVPAATAETPAQLNRLIGLPTAADISPDRHTLAVLTYQSLLLYHRRPEQSWGQAVQQLPQRHDLPPLPQAEALAWSRGGTGLFLTSEFSPAPLYWLRPALQTP